MDLKTREKFIKTVIWIIVIAFVTTIFATWGAHYNNQQKNDPIAITVNGTEITKEEYFRAYNKQLEDAKKYYDDELTDTQILEIRNSVADQFIQNVLLKNLAEKYDASPTLKDIQTGVAKYFMDDKKQFNAQAFEYHKKNQSAAWWERLEKAAIEESIISKAELLLTDKVKVSDDEIKLYFAASSVQAKVQQIFLNPALLIDTPAAETYYKENLSDFLKPEKRYVRHIIISDTDLTDDTAGCISSIKINNIYDKLRSGEKFEELANNFSDEPYKIVNEEKDKNDKKKGGLKIYKGGDLGWLTKEDLSQEEGVTENFIETVFNLKEYEISDIIRTQKGWQIVQATEIGDTEYYSLSDKAMVIKQKLVSDTEINKTLEKAKLIKSELTDTGANFIQLVKKYSNANSRDTQGIAGYIPRAEFTRSSFLEDTTLSLIKEIPVSYTGNGLFTDNEFSDSIFILKLNEVSAPIKSKLGIHIVKILDYKMPDLIDYKEEYPDSYRKILIMKARSIVDSWYKSEKKKSKIKYSFGEPNFLTKAEKSDR